MDRCAECGFVYVDLPREQIAASLRLVAAQYRSPFGDDPGVRSRPAPNRWSALEYAAHVRDVLTTQRERAALALRVREPVFGSMRADERAIEQRYNDQDPIQVISELEHAASSLASLFDSLGPSEWQRSGIYNWPTTASRDLVWIGRHTVHELSHHLLDVSRAVEPTPSAASG